MGCAPGSSASVDFGTIAHIDFDRCPLAELNEATAYDYAWIDYVIRLTVAKRQGSLSPFPGAYSARTLMLVDVAENAIIALEKELREIYQREADVEAARRRNR